MKNVMKNVMKRSFKCTIVVFALLAAVLLSSCKKADPVPINCDFTARVTATNQEKTESYVVTNTGKGVTTITYTQPDSLRGLTYSYKGSAVTLNYRGFSYTPSASLPSGGMAKTLYSALNTIAKSQPMPSIEVHGETAVHENAGIRVSASATTGEISEINIKGSNTTYTFSHNEE